MWSQPSYLGVYVHFWKRSSVQFCEDPSTAKSEGAEVDSPGWGASVREVAAGTSSVTVLNPVD